MLTIVLLFVITYVGTSAILGGGLSVGSIVVGIILGVGTLIPTALLKRQSPPGS